MNLEISSPYQENDNYVFPISINAEQISYFPKSAYTLNKNGDKYDLSIKNKTDLQYFNVLKKTIIEELHKNQDNWFEDSFKIDDLENMFS